MAQDHEPTQDIPIHSCTFDGMFARVYRKVNLYATEQVCFISVAGPDMRNRALELASMLCEALEAQRERSQ